MRLGQGMSNRTLGRSPTERLADEFIMEQTEELSRYFDVSEDEELVAIAQLEEVQTSV